jgi:hypothetical protein
MKPIERLKFFMFDIISFLAVLIFIAFIALILYGIETQCPDVVIYEYCGK